MATRRATIGEILPPEQGGGIAYAENKEILYISEEENTEERELEKAIAELGASGTDAKINVFLLEPGKGSAFVGSYDPSNFSIEEIQRTYGPGEYKVHVRRGGTMIKNRIIKIAAPKIPPSVQTNAGIEKLSENMQAGLNAIAQMISQTLQAIAANQQPQKTTEDMLREMMLMKELLAQPVQHNNNDSNTLDMFLRGVEFAKEITPRDSEVSTNELILEGVKHLGGAFGAMKQLQANGVMPQTVATIQSKPGAHAQATPQAIQNTLVKPSAATPAPHSPQNLGATSSGESLSNDATISAQAELHPQPQPDLEQLQMMKHMALNVILANAVAGNDTETYANLALDMLGDKFCLNFVNDPEWFENLCTEIPGARDYKPWFEDMRNAIFELTEAETPANTNHESATVGDVGEVSRVVPGTAPDTLASPAPNEAIDANQSEQANPFIQRSPQA